MIELTALPIHKALLPLAETTNIKLFVSHFLSIDATKKNVIKLIESNFKGERKQKQKDVINNFFCRFGMRY